MLHVEITREREREEEERVLNGERKEEEDGVKPGRREGIKSRRGDR